MITYSADGTTLTGTNLDGSQFRVSINDSNYYQVWQVLQNQLTATQENKDAKILYMENLQTYQAYLQNPVGTVVTAPAKPQMISVSDQGVTSKGPFVPPLPDPIPVTYAPSNPTGALQPQVGPTTDQRLAIIQGMLAQILAKFNNA